MAKLTIRAGASSVEQDITGKNLLHVLMNAYPNGISDATVFIGKEQVDLSEFDINRVINDDVVVIAPPKGIIEAATAIFVAVAASVVSSLVQVDVPSVTSTGAKTSPNDDFSGQTNQVRLNDQEPNIYGNVVSYPDLVVGEGGYWEYIDNQKIVRETFLIGSGAYQINDEPRYEQTALSDINGSTYEIIDAYNYIPVMYGQFNAEIVDGQGLPGPNNDDVEDGIMVESDGQNDRGVYVSSTQRVVYNAVNPTADLLDLAEKYGDGELFFAEITYQVRVTDGNGICGFDTRTINGQAAINAYQGTSPAYYQVNIYLETDESQCTDVDGYGYTDYFKITERTGAVVNVTLPIVTDEIQLSFDFRRGLKGRCDVQAVLTDGNHRLFKKYSFEADTTSPQYFTEKIPNTFTDKVDVTVYRTNNDKDDGSDSCQLTQVASNSYRYNVYAGDRTLITTERKATEQATSFAESKINVDVTRKTVTWSEETGLVTTRTASRSFADAILHEYYEMNELTDISKLPLAEMYEAADRIGDLGYFDGTFSDAEQSLKEKMNIIANAARGIISFTGQGYEFYRDEPRLPVAQFDSRNISADSNDEISYKGTTQRSNDGVQLQWKNPETNKSEYIYVKVQGDTVTECIWDGSGYTPEAPITPLVIELTGCYNYNQAIDRALLEARKIIYIQQALTITTLKDGDNVTRGEVVKYADYYEEDIASGEVKSVTNGNLIESYSRLGIAAGSYYVTYTDQFGAMIGPIECNVIDDYHFIADMTDAYVADGYNQQCGSRFILSTIEEHETNLFEVKEKQVNSDGTVELELLQYSENVYS